ncbi:MAG TPA: hypothetical protein VLZ81_08925 [Blastocatellia bacterium]|nr:hypothetical protein [Blastocatellia bacterium]
MKRSDIAKLVPAVIVSLILGGLLTAWAWGKPAPQAAGPQAVAGQQQQLDRLKQLEDKLSKDRQSLHLAAAQSGWDSDQADLAQEQLFQDREEYRKLRRALRREGVAVPPPYGAGADATGGHPSSRSPSAGSHGMCAHCPSMDDCSCCPR